MASNSTELSSEFLHGCSDIQATRVIRVSPYWSTSPERDKKQNNPKLWYSGFKG